MQEFLEKATAMAPSRGDVLRAATVCAKRGDDKKAAHYPAELDLIKKKRDRGESAMGVRHEMQDEANLPARVAEVLRYAGRTYLDHGEPALGEKCLLHAAEVCPQDLICRQMLANACDKQGRLEESLRWVQEVRRLAPGDLEHIENEGVLNARLNRLDEANGFFASCAGRRPKAPWAISNSRNSTPGRAETLPKPGRWPKRPSSWKPRPRTGRCWRSPVSGLATRLRPNRRSNTRSAWIPAIPLSSRCTARIHRRN